MKIFVQNDRFIDQVGRQVILHGVNMVCKEKEAHYVCQWDENDFAKLQKWGFNVIRFGVYWDGLEPEPGEYHDDYIEKLRKQIQLAHQYRIRVILDMHQDLYSAMFGGVLLTGPQLLMEKNMLRKMFGVMHIYSTRLFKELLITFGIIRLQKLVSEFKIIIFKHGVTLCNNYIRNRILLATI